ncbi:MAG: DeoR/GlpR family DNA-binding transcription regulator [Anaerolineales bacterium]
MKSLSERQNRLLEWLKTRQTASVEEVQAAFEISTPTAYRDVRALLEAGAIQRLGQEIRLAPAEDEKNCVVCHGEINERTAFIFHLQDGTRRSACCPHCGLMALQRLAVDYALTPDFLYGRMVNVRQAAFLLGGDVSLCCQPPVLCFASQADALNFQKGFGGHVGNLEEAQLWVRQAMTIG